MEKRKACKLSKNGLWAVKTCADSLGWTILPPKCRVDSCCGWSHQQYPTMLRIKRKLECSVPKKHHTFWPRGLEFWQHPKWKIAISHLSWNLVFFPAEFSSPTPRRSSRSESLLRRACHGWIFSDAISLAQPSCLERFANNQGSSPFCMWRWSENGISYPQMAISMGILIKIHNLKIEGALDSDKPEN